MLDFNALKLIKPNNCIDWGKPPSEDSVKKVFSVFTSPMTTKQICTASGCSITTVLLVLKFMNYYGDYTANKWVNTPTGTTKLLNEHDLKSIPKSNTGVTGVSFVASTNTFHACYGAKISLTFNNLFDAVCGRKSLELSKC